MKLPEGNPLQRPALLLGFLGIGQIFLGLGSWMTRIMMEESVRQSTSAVFFATAHQATGALILATIVYLTLLAFRCFKEPVRS